MNYRCIRCERQNFGRAPEYFIKVKQNQAVTPSQIAELTEMVWLFLLIIILFMTRVFPTLL